MKDKIAKVIGELTPINVKFVGKKKITCEIKESELVKRLTQLFKSELDEQREEIKEKIKETGDEYWGTEAFSQGYVQAKTDILKELNK